MKKKMNFWLIIGVSFLFFGLTTNNSIVHAEKTSTSIQKRLPTVSINFDSNGGSSLSPLKFDKGDTLTKPKDPTKQGYTFDGWYKDNTFSELYDFNNPDTSISTVYAKWLQDEADIILTPEDFNIGPFKIGTVVTDEDLKKLVMLSDKNYSLSISITPNLDRDNDNKVTKLGRYQITYTASNGTNQQTEVFDFLVVPTNFRDFTLNFDSNGGSSVSPLTFDEGDTLTKPKDPTKQGYTFDGWYKDNTFSELYDFDNPDTNISTVYAKWSKNSNKKITVIFNSNGGSLVSNQEIDMNHKVIKPKNPTKNGFVFSGWFSDDQLTNPYNFDTLLNNSITLYAKWDSPKLNTTSKPTAYTSKQLPNTGESDSTIVFSLFGIMSIMISACILNLKFRTKR